MRTAARCLIALALTVACSPGGGAVVRVVEGREIRGRAISAGAYAAYLRGAYHEGRGELPRAENAYRDAVRLDSRSPEIWSRLGAVRCRGDREGAATAFRRAERLDEDYAPLWFEHARCHLLHRNLPAARASAERAARLDPDRLETTLLLAEVYEQAGEHERALRWLRALVLRHPHFRPGWTALFEAATRTGEAAMRAQAREALAAAASTATRPVEDESIDQALLRDHLVEARALALRARRDGGELAVRAAALGRLELAAEQAELVLGADPDNTDASVAALVVADLKGDDEALSRWLRRLGDEPVRPSREAARLMTALLERRIGKDAARAWERATALQDEDEAQPRRSSRPER